ncbi:MAG: MBL fold metallo-hydrolase, partial [Lachnospiraceae bacterium]|nr:MBL fold metallo-hydrolase [Lachnospiraceae bacterium]
MKITFIGADHEVTGSCHMISACGKHILLDCGMEQGRDTFVNQNIPVNPGEIDYVFLSHAHIDHSGLIPLLYKHGFKGEIHCTYGTYDLCDIMLRDSAHIQESDSEWKNRKAQRSGKDQVEPLYTSADVEGVLQHFVPHDYNEKIQIAAGIEIRFTDVGHLLGSASIEIWLTEDGKTTKIVYSGDIGNNDQPIIENPSYTKDADYVIIESTYGDRYHEKAISYIDALTPIIQNTLDR